MSTKQSQYQILAREVALESRYGIERALRALLVPNQSLGEDETLIGPVRQASSTAGGRLLSAIICGDTLFAASITESLGPLASCAAVVYARMTIERQPAPILRVAGNEEFIDIMGLVTSPDLPPGEALTSSERIAAISPRGEAGGSPLEQVCQGLVASSLVRRRAAALWACCQAACVVRAAASQAGQSAKDLREALVTSVIVQEEKDHG